VIDGFPVVDAHMHVPRLSTVSQAWRQWAVDFGKTAPWRDVFDADGNPVPASLDALLDAEGVDTALIFAEYSPRATGVQPVEDILGIVEYNPRRFRLVANVNPELHRPPVREAERQLALGAVAVKVHPVHGGFDPVSAAMNEVYELCAARGVPVITHTGPSIFPGSVPEYGDPKLMARVAADHPGLSLVLAHGGRGHWYADAARMALTMPNVWLDLAGLPPRRLPDYYRDFSLAELAGKWIFGTDWPGVPGTKANVRAIAALGLPEDTLRGVFAGNARRVYHGIEPGPGPGSASGRGPGWTATP
jgi:uncharacterized protein